MTPALTSQISTLLIFPIELKDVIRKDDQEGMKNAERQNLLRQEQVVLNTIFNEMGCCLKRQLSIGGSSKSWGKPVFVCLEFNCLSSSVQYTWKQIGYISRYRSFDF